MPTSLVMGLAAVTGGMLIAAQGPLYARMSALLGGNPLVAAFIAFLLATIVLGLLLLARQPQMPGMRHLGALPWWVWFGGMIGVYQVLVSIQAVPRLGVTLFLMLVILGNMAGAVILDHFGGFGLPRRPVSPHVIIGIALVLAGAFVTASRP